MDEKLKNQLLISVLPAGLAFIIYQLGFNRQGSLMGFVLAFVLAAVLGGATFGILYLVQKD